MSYQVLARKWRPQTFDDVVGQESVVQTLKRALDTERVAHAFLFCGSRGIGKTTLARLMAKALCCEKGVTSEPDGTCSQCKAIAEGSSVDIVEIDGASHTGVDDIRELREATRFQPQSARYRIFIIDEVHMLSNNAFNALLKTLEEPPPHVKFIFATTEPHKIPVTILSRCQRYDFKRISTDVIVARLQDVLGRESTSLPEPSLRIIARAAAGGMRDALSLTDQVISFAGEGASPEKVAEALGLIDRRSVWKATRAICGRDARGALEVVESAFDKGHDLKQLAEAIAEELRNLAVSSATGSVRGFVDLTDEEIGEVDAAAAQEDPRDLQRLLQHAVDAIDLVTKTENLRFALELTVIQMCDRPPLADAMAISEALARLDLLTRGKPVPPPTPRGGGPPGGHGPAQQIAADASAVTPTASTPPAAAAPTAPEAPAPRDPGPAERAQRSTPPPVAAPGRDEGGEAQSAPDPSIDGAAETDDDDDGGYDPNLGLTLEGIDPAWQAFIDEVARQRRRLGGHLEHGHFLGPRGDAVRVAFKVVLHREAVEEALTSDAVTGAMAAFGGALRLEVEQAETDADLPPSIAEARETAIEKAQASLEAHARAHPVVKKALELFGGEIRAVRR